MAVMKEDSEGGMEPSQYLAILVIWVMPTFFLLGFGRFFPQILGDPWPMAGTVGYFASVCDTLDHFWAPFGPFWASGVSSAFRYFAFLLSCDVEGHQLRKEYSFPTRPRVAPLAFCLTSDALGHQLWRFMFRPSIQAGLIPTQVCDALGRLVPALVVAMQRSPPPPLSLSLWHPVM